jgi:hypothetical protein
VKAAKDRSSNYVIQRRFGQVYFAFVPSALANHDFARCVDEFSSLDHALRIESRAACFKKVKSAYIAFERARASADFPVQRYGSADSLANVLAFFATRKVSSEYLVELNSAALEVRRSAFRHGAMWIGAATPSMALYVAPPPDNLRMLIKDLSRFLEYNSSLPITLRASVAMGQFLLIHPFLDGNGRTARALFLSFAARFLGFSLPLVATLELFWEFEGSRIHGATAVLRSDDSWNYFLSVARDVIYSSIRPN